MDVQSHLGHIQTVIASQLLNATRRVAISLTYPIEAGFSDALAAACARGCQVRVALLGQDAEPQPGMELESARIAGAQIRWVNSANLVPESIKPFCVLDDTHVIILPNAALGTTSADQTNSALVVQGNMVLVKHYLKLFSSLFTQHGMPLPAVPVHLVTAALARELDLNPVEPHVPPITVKPSIRGNLDPEQLQVDTGKLANAYQPLEPSAAKVQVMATLPADLPPPNAGYHGRVKYWLMASVVLLSSVALAGLVVWKSGMFSGPAHAQGLEGMSMVRIKPAEAPDPLQLFRKQCQAFYQEARWTMLYHLSQQALLQFEQPQADVYACLAIAQYNLGQLKEAEEQMRLAVELRPEDTNLRDNLTAMQAALKPIERLEQPARSMPTAEASNTARIFSKNDILQIQTALKRQGWYRGRLHGVYDQPTQEALAAFQRWAMIPITGEADSITLKALNLDSGHSS